MSGSLASESGRRLNALTAMLAVPAVAMGFHLVTLAVLEGGRGQALFQTSPASRVFSGGDVLLPGDGIWSANGRFHLVYQHDGNLVLYETDSGMWRWASHTLSSAGRAVLEPGGNVVVYDASNKAVWASNTDGHANPTLTVENDGVPTVRDGAGGVIWTAVLRR